MALTIDQRQGFTHTCKNRGHDLCGEACYSSKTIDVQSLIAQIFTKHLPRANDQSWPRTQISRKGVAFKGWNKFTDMVQRVQTHATRSNSQGCVEAWLCVVLTPEASLLAVFMKATSRIKETPQARLRMLSPQRRVLYPCCCPSGS